MFFHKSDEKKLIVTLLESTFVYQYIVRISSNLIVESIPLSTWDPTKYLTDRTGHRLAEEVYRKIKMQIDQHGIKPDGIAISLPGTLQNQTTILRSSRLGILEPTNFTELFEKKGMKCYLFHDTESIGIGEAKYGALKDGWPQTNTFAYILIDEGVGSTLFIDGKAYKGNGSAGHIGRLVVNPRGPYNPVFQSYGSLEVYAARPWVSRNIVTRYLSENGKNGAVGRIDEEFREKINLISGDEDKWNSLPYHILTKGWESEDSIAVSVIDDAASYIGFAINIIVAVTNPPGIIIGGGMKTHLRGFYEKILIYARRFSWTNAWNKTTIKSAVLDNERVAQIYGAAELFQLLLEKDL